MEKTAIQFGFFGLTGLKQNDFRLAAEAHDPALGGI
jgi:hypothetical protein